MKKSKFNVNRIAKDALLLALLVICAWVSIPVGASPITLQVFGVILIILLAPQVDSIIIVLAYVLMGSFGLPVFNGGTSGFTSITYGFIVGFLAASIIIYLYTIIFLRKRKQKLFDIIIKCVIFEIVIYIFGLSWFAVLSDARSFFGWFVYFLPYLGIDAIKCVVAVLIYTRLIPILKRQSEQNMRDDSEIEENEDQKDSSN